MKFRSKYFFDNLKCINFPITKLTVFFELKKLGTTVAELAKKLLWVKGFVEIK